MEPDNIKEIIPDQKTGAKTDTMHTVTAHSEQEAKVLYNTAKARLQDVDRWKQFCGAGSAEFRLTDFSGNAVNRTAQKGDFFRINIPAPGPEAGDGYDWVHIEAIEDKSNPDGDNEAFAIRVRPSQKPGGTVEVVAHFYKDDATSSFAVQRAGLVVTASIHGRNEKPNTDTDGILDKLRNAMVAIGAIIGMADPQWKSLVKGLLEKNNV